VAIDAEFVAVSRAETSFEGGVEVQLRPSRWVLLPLLLSLLLSLLLAGWPADVLWRG